MENNYDLFVIGAWLMAMAFILFVCYLLCDNFGVVLFGFVFGIVGLILFYLSKKIDGEKVIICTILFALITVIPMVITIKIITTILIIVCAFGIAYIILEPPDNKKQFNNSTAKT